MRKAETITTTVLLAAVYCTSALGQATPPSILTIDVVNAVGYENDVVDYSKLAADPNPTTAAPVKNFNYFYLIGDIVAVNGAPAKGAVVSFQVTLNSAPNAAPGQMMLDIARGNIHAGVTWEIQQPDGTPIGSIMGEGLGGGVAPPGAPLAATQGNSIVSGGTGAFLGVRGQWGTDASRAVPYPLASTIEDPANRRLRKGGVFRFVVHLIPMSYPEVVTTPDGPAVAHASDNSPVTAANPASAGEMLTMVASALGPTRPGLDPGKPFPADPPQVANSPVHVLINGVESEVVYAAGYPNTSNYFRVDFRVPDGVSAGTALVQVSAAWIAGPEVGIAVR
jgi:uncharacterized protein (TIGR03437 family)